MSLVYMEFNGGILVKTLMREEVSMHLNAIVLLRKKLANELKNITPH